MSDNKKKFNLNHNLGLLLIFLALLISNIILYAGLISFYCANNTFSVSLAMVNNILTMGAAIIILGFISTRLPQFRNLGDSSIYEIGYLIIFGILSIIISYFNKSTNTESFFAPFLNMFKILSVLLILMLLVTKTSFFKNIMDRKFTKKDLIVITIIFSFLGCAATIYHVPVDDSFANVRNLIVLIAGLFGGPFVGIPAGIISGGFRFIHGGPTAFPCSVATIIAGFIGSSVYILNGKKFLRGLSSIVLIFLYVGFEMLVILMLTPENISIPYIDDIYPLMLFASVLGMILFLMIINEDKTDKKINYEELRVNELENTIDEYGDKIEQLQEDIEELKKKKEV